MEQDFTISRLGDPRVDTPLASPFYLDEDGGVLLDASRDALRGGGHPAALERAGPRRKLFFDPPRAKAAIVTCGGLCPGINDVIRAITMVLWHRYGVRDILGLRYGYEGLIPSAGEPPVPLTPESVEDIHQHGGTILGSSRGPRDVAAMVDFLVAEEIGMLFTIGGDGTQRGALAISEELRRRGKAVAVVGVPKTIDNDILYTTRTFGFETAVAMSELPITCAHMEAKGVRNGVGLVKLMGRDSGFVAAYAALASSDVNLVLVPEIPFTMAKVLAFLDDRLARKSHAVIVVAEGAGQDVVPPRGTDVSGNKILADVGRHLKREIREHFRASPHPAVVKYIDPSYTIRSAPANAADSVFCFQLAANAVHAAMSGRTAMVTAIWNGQYVHVPMSRAISSRKKIVPGEAFWQSVLDNTGQPASLA